MAALDRRFLSLRLDSRELDEPADMSSQSRLSNIFELIVMLRASWPNTASPRTTASSRFRAAVTGLDDSTNSVASSETNETIAVTSLDLE